MSGCTREKKTIMDLEWQGQKFFQILYAGHSLEVLGKYFPNIVLKKNTSKLFFSTLIKSPNNMLRQTLPWYGGSKALIYSRLISLLL